VSETRDVIFDEPYPIAHDPYPVAETYRQHDCYAWNVQMYQSRPEYLSSCCCVCGKITGFRWRKWWRRIYSLFSGEPHIRTKSEE
jgi:hypothetical protein